MSGLQQYATELDRIFGAGTAKFKLTGAGNDVVATFASSVAPGVRTGIVARLERLNRVYQQPTRDRVALIKKANELGTANWEGTFAELAALDFVHSNRDLLGGEISLDVIVRAQDTFAAELEKPGEPDLDLHFSWFDVYADVKVLKDNVREILDNSIRQAGANGRGQPRVLPQYTLDMGLDLLRPNRSQLVQELAAALEGAKTFMNSTAVPGLTFKIRYDAGVMVTEGAYHPHRHAENLAPSFYGYASKFHKKRPFILVMLSFPWFNNLVTSFGDANKEFYRALARRVFCQHKHLPDPFSSLRRFTGPDTIYEVTRRVSAILFLEEKSIDAPNTRRCNVDGYLFTNPNAGSPVAGHPVEDYLRSLPLQHTDDFHHDNY